MKVEETGQLGFYRFSKTALPIGRDLTNRAQVLSVEGLDGVKGPVLGRYKMTSFLKKEDNRRWYLPAIEYLGKLGQPNGPSLASVMELAQLRKTFLAGLPPMLEASGQRWRSKGRRSRPRRPRRPSTGRRRRKATIARITRITTSTTSTSALEEPASANGAWNC